MPQGTEGDVTDELGMAEVLDRLGGRAGLRGVAGKIAVLERRNLVGAGKVKFTGALTAVRRPRMATRKLRKKERKPTDEFKIDTIL